MSILMPFETRLVFIPNCLLLNLVLAKMLDKVCTASC